jgi:phage terminase large subunit
MPEINIQFPEKLRILREPARYKIPYGGRGSAKSWTIARICLLDMLETRMRILYSREIQKSIQESSYALLVSQINKLGLRNYFDIQKTTIKSLTGSDIIFAGLKHNIDSIRSVEGINRVVIEEAHNVSKSSLDVLIPTIREPNSEIWLSFNPSLETDEVYKRFVINAPDNAIAVEVNWSDNPWFPEVLKEEMAACKARSIDDYMHIWEGKCRQTLEGAVFAEELRQAALDKRICRVPYDPSHKVDIYTDLGWSDFFSAWFVQRIGLEYRIIDFLQDQLKGVAHYAKEFQRKQYVYGTLHLPHDGKAQQFAAGGRSVEMQFRSLGFDVRTQPAPPENKKIAISAARAVFPLCIFDEGKCADGLQSLRYYHYKKHATEEGKFSQSPEHDWSSHASDAFMLLGLTIPKLEMTGRPQRPRRPPENQGSWMTL